MTDQPIERRLRRGVNLSHWFGQVYMAPGYVPEHFDAWMTARDLDLVAAMGFDHVRLPLAVDRMADPGGTGVGTEMTARVLDAVDALVARGLAVIVDAHPEEELKQAVAADDDALVRFASLWGDLAARLADRPDSHVAFEILNEPGMNDSARWAMVARRSLDAIRAAAPSHAVVVSGDHYSEVPELLRMPELDDPRVIYNVHLYDPPALSHQGAYWGPAWFQETRGLDYPADRANVAGLREAARDPEAIAALDDYLAESWGADRYRALLEPAAAFARERGVMLTCNEFGVYRDFVPRAGRLRWLRDVTGVLEELGAGWTVWDYAGDFGVVTGEPGAREPDEEVLAALGLAG